MIDVDELLAPLSEDTPCGEDLSYDPALSELDTLMQGKPETQFSAAEEPNWKDVQKSCLALFERSKDLRVSIDLTVPLLKLDGWPGFAQGLVLLQGLLEKYWEPIYPRLDPEDNNDPLQRMNLIASLAAPEGTFGDALRFISRLRETPLCRSTRGGSFTLTQIAAALSVAPPPGTPDVTAISAAFKDSDAEFLQSQRDAIDQANVAAFAIDTFITDTVGSSSAPNLQPLKDVLREAKQRLATYAPPPVTAGEGDSADGTDAGLDALGDLSGDASSSGASRARGGAPGTISSREDVMAAMDAICAYYGANEPSSPVAALLVQARKLVGLNFMEILQILSPEATPQVKLVAEPAADASAETTF